MVTIYGNTMDSAFTEGTSVVAIYTYGCMVWPSEEPWSGSGIGPEVHPGDYYISWTPDTATGRFSISGVTYSLDSYSGYFNNFDGSITENAFKNVSTITTLETNAVYVASTAFMNCDNLTTASLSYASFLSTSAFANCGSLSTVSLSRCLSLGSQVFNHCYYLKYITLPQCSIIGIRAFYDTASYKYMTLGYLSSVVSMNQEAIQDQTIYSLEVPAHLLKSYLNSPWSEKMTGYPDVLNINAFHYLSYSGYYSSYFSGSGLFSSNFSSNDISSFETNAIGAGVGCCQSMTSLLSVYMPYCSRVVGDSAFKDCTNLQTVILSSAVVQIFDSAFYNCYNLDTINFKTLAIGSNAFIGCSSLSTFTMYSVNCNYIGSYAFKDCENLINFKVGAGLSQYGYICSLHGSTVFDGCSNLQKIYVPASLYSDYKSADEWSYFSDIIYSY